MFFKIVMCNIEIFNILLIKIFVFLVICILLFICMFFLIKIINYLSKFMNKFFIVIVKLAFVKFKIVIK